MRILVAGSGGQLGRALVAAAPADVSLLAPPEAGLDITDAAAIARAIDAARPDLLVNAAAYTAVDRAEQEPEAAYAVNARAPGLLAAAAARAGAGFVHVSTDFVFDGRAHAPYAPDAAPGPLGVYGASKLAGEEAVRAAHPRALVVRTAWVYAARGGNFVHTMLRLMRERAAVRVVADQIGTPTHAASLARALLTLGAAGATGTHHWTDAGVASWYDFAVAIAEEALARAMLPARPAVRPISTADFPTPARRPAFSVLDTASARALAGEPAHWRAELRLCLNTMQHETAEGTRT